jgi:hypothetical protein
MHGLAGVQALPEESLPVVLVPWRSENKMGLACPAPPPPAIPPRLLITRNIGELPLLTVELHDVAARSAAAVRVRVIMRMRLIVLPVTS